MLNNKLILFLAILITLDYATTFVGVLGMGATEINPFFKYFPSLYHWFFVKFIVGIFCLSCLAWFEATNKKIVNVGLLILNMIYLIVVSSNFYQIYSNI